MKRATLFIALRIFQRSHNPNDARSYIVIARSMRNNTWVTPALETF